MPQEDRKNLSVQVVSIVGYLIGVKEEIFTREFKTTVYKTLETKPEAKTLRALCTIRTALIKHNGSISARLRNEAFSNINKMPEFIDSELFTFLSSQGNRDHQNKSKADEIPHGNQQTHKRPHKPSAAVLPHMGRMEIDRHTQFFLMIAELRIEQWRSRRSVLGD